MILVTLPALEVFASCAALPDWGVLPWPVTRSQSQPMSGNIDNVATRSNQKKKVKKYSSLQREPRTNSVKKITKQAEVKPKKISSY